MIKVLVVDDQTIMREGLKYILETDNNIAVVGCAENGKDAFRLCGKLQPDIVLMDIVMPVCDGIEGTRMIKSKYDFIKVLILTAHNEKNKILNALINGADGYLLKDIMPEDMILSVKSAANGIKVIHKNSFPFILKQIQPENKISTRKRIPSNIKLTERELDIIRMVADGKSASEIGNTLYLSEGRIRNIISVLLQKLELRDRVQLAVFAIKNELV